MSIAEKLAEYDGLLPTAAGVSYNDGDFYATFNFYDQQGGLLMRSTGHPVSYEDRDSSRRFPHSNDTKTYVIDITADGTANRLSISLFSRDGVNFAEDITMQTDCIDLASGNTITITPEKKGLLRVDKKD